MKKYFLSIWPLAYLMLLCFCADAQMVKFSEWKNLTTSGRLPPQCKLQRSNNNLDLVRYQGRYYLAFRTAPTHFASRRTIMYIVSSADLVSWQYESEIRLGRDVREPRFAVYHDTLNLYFFSGGKSVFSFEPRQMFVSRTAGGQRWTALQTTYLDGFVPWRLRQRDDTLYMSAYYGRNLYNKKHKADLRLFYSTDGTSFQCFSVDAQVDVQDAEEGEFIFDKRGNLFATVRLEGMGGLICKADNCNIGSWQKVKTKHKYDSALLFSHNDDIYLISRRNIDGPMDKSRDTTDAPRHRFKNMMRYWFTTKVTALFKLNKKDLSLALVTDLPSTGDTAFPGIVQVDNDNYILMNYSSNIKGRKKNWISGQLGKTYIYQTKLTFEPEPIGLK